MPGDRLTEDQRRRIADGLAGGLPYAEIARRLGRPTSTVTREVARNGGRDSYRPESAQRETERRYRRPKRARSASGPTLDGSYGREPEAVQDFEERLAILLMGTGLPRMMARVLACLAITDAGSCTAAELTDRLQVSPASISTAVAYLDGQGFVRRERDQARGPERYILDDDLWYRAMLASVRNNFAMADATLEGSRILGPSSPAGARLEGMGRFLQYVGRDLLERSEHWKRIITEQMAGRGHPE